MKVLILLSGGVESTALIKHGLSEKTKDYYQVNNIEVECLHVCYSRKLIGTRTGQELVQSKKICDHYGVKLWTFIRDLGDFGVQYPKVVRDALIWFSDAIIVAAAGDFDEVWFGNHADDNYGLMRQLYGMWQIQSEATFNRKPPRLRSPLRLVRKLDQWNSIPEVHDLVKTCTIINDDSNGKCGECMKCKEFDWYINQGKKEMFRG
jgi:7-cyano-7-deazaguanine synthase in queuosine biosynthesis